MRGRIAPLSNQVHMSLQNQIERVYTDGACSGNPGPGGWGVVAYLGNGTVHEIGGRESKTTNNRMELQAAIAALDLLINSQQGEAVTLYTDSEYVKNGITKWIAGWKKKKWKTSTGKAVVNQDLWKQLDTLNTSLKNQLPLTWEYVKGHAGDEGNERSDIIARAFSQNSPPALNTAHEIITGHSTANSLGSASNGSSDTKNATSTVSSEAPAHNESKIGPPLDADQQTTQATNLASSNLTQPLPYSGNMSSTETLHQLRDLVETFRIADVIAEQCYLITTSELADLVGISVTTATNRGDRWIWRNWLVTRVRQESNQILWQLERVS